MNQPGPIRRSLPLAAVVLACALAALVTSVGNPGREGRLPHAWHQYEYLAEGFFHGHTYLSLAPEPPLLALPDPYDPAQNWRYRLWDATLYKGRYYLYFGPAPALLMLPWRLVAGSEPSQRLCVGLAATAGLLALALLVRDASRRFLADRPPWATAVGVAGAFHAAWLPVILRRSGVWELAIATAVASLWWALYFLLRFHLSGGRTRWAVLGGCSLALLVGSRVTYVPASLMIACLFAVPAAGAPRRLRVAGLPAPVLLAAAGCALLIYNLARFGNGLEFGQTNQLWGMDERHVAHMSLTYVPFNLRAYFLSMPQFGPYFPFLHPFWTDALPRGYLGLDEVYGVLFMLPVHAVGLASVLWWWRRRADPLAAPMRVTLLAAGLTSVLSVGILMLWAGACSRYISELCAGWTVVTAFGLVLALGPGHARWIRIASAAACIWTVIATWFASADFHGYGLGGNAVYDAEARILNVPSAWIARMSGVTYGPLDLTVRIPAGARAGSTVLLANGRPGQVNFLLATTDGSGHFRLSLLYNQIPIVETPSLDASPGPMRVRIAAPWLYPPAAHPYWSGIANAAALKTFFMIDWGGGAVRGSSIYTADPAAFRPIVLGPGDAAPLAPRIESLKPAAGG